MPTRTTRTTPNSVLPDRARITSSSAPVFDHATPEPVWPSLPPSVLADPAASDALPVRVDPVRPTRTGFSDRWRAEQGR